MECDLTPNFCRFSRRRRASYIAERGESLLARVCGACPSTVRNHIDEEADGSGKQHSLCCP